MKKILLTLLTALSLTVNAEACEYPCKPISFLMSVAAGGPSDTLFIRPFGEWFRKETGQPLVVEYLPAAEGVVQIRKLRASTPDGYTLGLVRSATAVYKPVMDTVDYDPIGDFTNIGFFVRFPDAIYVNSNSPYLTFNDLIAKAPPKGLNVGMSFHGARVLTYMLRDSQKIYIEPIMYPGDVGANNALIGNQLDAVIGTIGGTPINLHKNGQLRILATSGNRRVPSIPDIPTLRELGIPLEQYTFFALGGPPNMDPAVVKRLNELLNKYMRDPEVQARANNDGMFTPAVNTPEAMNQYISKEIKYWDSFRVKHNVPKVGQ